MAIHYVEYGIKSFEKEKRMFVNAAGLNCFMHVQVFLKYLSIFVHICGHF